MLNVSGLNRGLISERGGDGIGREKGRESISLWIVAVSITVGVLVKLLLWVGCSVSFPIIKVSCSWLGIEHWGNVFMFVSWKSKGVTSSKVGDTGTSWIGNEDSGLFCKWLISIISNYCSCRLTYILCIASCFLFNVAMCSVIAIPWFFLIVLLFSEAVLYLHKKTFSSM